MVAFLLALFTGRHETSSAWESEGLAWTMETDWLHDLRPSVS
jgi:hypothetical protein